MKLTSSLHLLPKLRINERYVFITCAGKPAEKSCETGLALSFPRFENVNFEYEREKVGRN